MKHSSHEPYWLVIKDKDYRTNNLRIDSIPACKVSSSSSAPFYKELDHKAVLMEMPAICKCTKNMQTEVMVFSLAYDVARETARDPGNLRKRKR